MAEACGACCRSFVPSREINESLKCACQRPFFSQIIKENNLPSHPDCWIKVPTKFARHYSALFGNTVNLEGDDGRSCCCSFVGSDNPIVGFGFEWFSFASSHNVRRGDQVVLTLMENSRFLVQVYKADPPLAEVKMEHDVDIQLAGRQDWLQAKVRKCGINVTVKVEQDGDDLPAIVDRAPGEAHGSQELNDKIADDLPSQEEIDGQSLQGEGQSEDAKGGNAEIDGAAASLSSDLGSQELNDEIANDLPSQEEIDGQSLQAEAQSEDAKSGNAEIDGASASSSSDSDYSLRRSKRKMFGSGKKSGPNNSVEVSDDEVSGAAMSDDRSTSSLLLYIQKNRDFPNHWAEPGTTRRKTYVSKRRPVTSAEKRRVLEVAKACPVSHSSYLKQLGNDNVYRALYLIVPAPWKRKNMPTTKGSYKGTLLDEEGNSWESRINGRVIFWDRFSLDHRLEEGDVVVMELVDSRIESLKFVVHIFRVVDVKVVARGKKGWADHFTIVNGKKETQGHQKRPKAQGIQKASSASGRRLKRKRAHAPSHLENSQKPRKERLTRLQAALQSIEKMSANATYRTVDSEHDSEDSLPLRQARDSGNDGGLQSIEKMSANATHRTVDSEHDSEDSLPLKQARDSDNDGGLQSIEKMSANASHRTLDSEHDSEDSLFLKQARDSDNDGGSTPPSGTYSGPGSSSARAGPSSTKEEAERTSRKECIVCWNAPVEAACIPCGHIAGCIDCLTKIKNKDWGCPVCRASLQQVVKVYAV